MSSKPWVAHVCKNNFYVTFGFVNHVNHETRDFIFNSLLIILFCFPVSDKRNTRVILYLLYTYLHIFLTPVKRGYWNDVKLIKMLKIEVKL